MILPTEFRNRVIDFIIRYPHIHTINGRRALILSSALDERLQCQIQYEGSTDEFCQLLVSRLITDGRDSFCALLDAVKNTLGKEWHEYHNALIADIRDCSSYSAVSDSSRHDILDQRLLPYLSDRSKQEYELTKILQSHKENLSRRPFICIIHGDQQECHDMFLERLRTITLPKFFEMDTEQSSIGGPWYIEWPSTDEGVNERLCKLHYNLASRVVGRGHVTTDIVAETFFQYKKPCIICARVLSQDWHNQETELIKNWLKFWNDDWPDMIPGQSLFVFLNIIYESVERRDFFHKVLNKKVFIKKIENFVTQINFEHYDHLSGITLPRLKAISRSDAEHWVLYWVSRYAPTFCNIQDLLNEIQRLYQQSNNLTREGSIPMQKLACSLIKVMQELSATGRIRT